jgi:uncharacterized protein YkwD
MKRYLYVLLIVALFALQACATDAAPVEGDEAGSLIPPVSSDASSLSLEGSAGAANDPIKVSPEGQCTASDSNAAQFAADVILLVNQERAAAGLNAVTSQAQLTQAAQAHSLDMGCNFFMSHTGSDGSSPLDRIKRTSYPFTWWGENVAAGYRTPATVMTGWMNSAPHKANILNPNFTEIGIGYVYNPNDTVNRYSHYWTMVLGSQQ